MLHDSKYHKSKKFQFSLSSKISISTRNLFILLFLNLLYFIYITSTIFFFNVGGPNTQQQEQQGIYNEEIDDEETILYKLEDYFLKNHELNYELCPIPNYYYSEINGHCQPLPNTIQDELDNYFISKQQLLAYQQLDSIPYDIIPFFCIPITY